jgi:hypothetical protein
VQRALEFTMREVPPSVPITMTLSTGGVVFSMKRDQHRFKRHFVIWEFTSGESELQAIGKIIAQFSNNFFP